MSSKPKDIDDYISRYTPEVQEILQQVRAAVKKAAPEARETIKYGMPAFTLKGNLVYFAAFKKHIGFYPVPYKDKTLEKDMAPYKQGKGSIQFPLDAPIPGSLITKLVKWNIQRDKEN